VKTITTPLSPKVVRGLKSGDMVFLSGTIYTARDQAHARIAKALVAGKKMPFDLRGNVIYFCGPTKTPPQSVIGSCGPTTSRRMDPFTPLLLQAGLTGMIGKGDRSIDVILAIKKYHGVYFLAYGGCGALISTFVRGCHVVAYHDLGPEAIYRLEVENLPLIVGVDSMGRNVYAAINS